MLQKYLGGETKLSQALTEVVITSYEIETCRPFLFTRRKARARRGARFDPRMWEVARSTTAAPAYFAPFQIRRSKRSHLPPLTFIDAGVFVNNPTLCAYAEAVGVHSRPGRRALRAAARRIEAERSPRRGSIRRTTLNPTGVDYLVLSLGTGEINAPIRYEDAKRLGNAPLGSAAHRHRL